MYTTRIGRFRWGSGRGGLCRWRGWANFRVKVRLRRRDRRRRVRRWRRFRKVAGVGEGVGTKSLLSLNRRVMESASSSSYSPLPFTATTISSPRNFLFLEGLDNGCCDGGGGGPTACSFFQLQAFLYRLDHPLLLCRV